MSEERIPIPDTFGDPRDIASRLRIRAYIRRNITSRKSVQEGKPDRLADLLDEAAAEIDRLRSAKS